MPAPSKVTADLRPMGICYKMTAIHEKNCRGPSPVPDPETGEIFCQGCGAKIPNSSSESMLPNGSQYGRGPDEAIVMENNIGTVPGPERAKQVMTALNGSGLGLRGIDFHRAKLDMLMLWSMSGDPTDRLVSAILKSIIIAIETKRGNKIPPPQIDAIARLCKAGVKRAELKKRLAKWEIEGIVHGIFRKEGYWPP